MSLISCFGHLVIGINDGIVGKGVVVAAVNVGVGSGCCAVVLLLSTKSFSNPDINSSNHYSLTDNAVVDTYDEMSKTTDERHAHSNEKPGTTFGLH
jgi:hypothetical protein